MSCSSKKQEIMTLSTIVAKFIAVSSCACKCIRLRMVIKKFQQSQFGSDN